MNDELVYLRKELDSLTFNRLRCISAEEQILMVRIEELEEEVYAMDNRGMGI